MEPKISYLYQTDVRGLGKPDRIFCRVPKSMRRHLDELADECYSRYGIERGDFIRLVLAEGMNVIDEWLVKEKCEVVIMCEDDKDRDEEKEESGDV